MDIYNMHKGIKDILRDMKNLGYRELQSQNIETSGGLLQGEVIVE